MRLEKYHAVDMQEAFRLIKAELGRDAVVIQTRKVRLGLFGWLKKPVYEVIAAVDEEAARPPKLAAAVANGAPKQMGTVKASRPAQVRTATVDTRPESVTARPARAQAAAYAAAPQAAPAAAAPAIQPAHPAATNGPSPTASVLSAEPATRSSDVEAPVKLESSDVALLREMKTNMV